MGTIIAIVIAAVLGGASYVGTFFWGYSTAEAQRVTIENNYITQKTTVYDSTETSVQNIQGQETIVTPVTNINLNLGVWSNLIRTTNYVSNNTVITNTKKK